MYSMSGLMTAAECLYKREENKGFHSSPFTPLPLPLASVQHFSNKELSGEFFSPTWKPAAKIVNLCRSLILWKRQKRSAHAQALC